jgi:hypothetical protein
MSSSRLAQSTSFVTRILQSPPSTPLLSVELKTLPRSQSYGLVEDQISINTHRAPPVYGEDDLIAENDTPPVVICQHQKKSGMRYSTASALCCCSVWSVLGGGVCFALNGVWGLVGATAGIPGGACGRYICSDYDDTPEQEERAKARCTGFASKQ